MGLRDSAVDPSNSPEIIQLCLKPRPVSHTTTAPVIQKKAFFSYLKGSVFLKNIFRDSVESDLSFLFSNHYLVVVEDP